MVTLKTREGLKESKWWINFVNHIYVPYGEEYTLALRNKELLKYGGIGSNTYENSYIDFEFDEDAIAFVLKWL